MKRGKYQQVTTETNPGKLFDRKGWVVITKYDCIGIYDSKAEAIEANLSPIAIVPVVVDYYVGDGLK